MGVREIQRVAFINLIPFFNRMQLDFQSPSPPPQSSRSPFVIGSAALLIVVAFGVLYFLGYGTSLWGWLNGGNTKAIESLEFVKQGDFTDAAARAEEAFAVLKPGTNAYFQARLALETATFWSGVSGNRLEAIHMAKQQYISAVDFPEIQANIINKLISYTSFGDVAVAKEIFIGEPFQSLNSATSTVLSLRNLAELSISLYPTSEAYLSLASYHARQLIQHKNGTDKISNKTRDKHVAAILDSIAKSDVLFESEKEKASGRSFGILYEPQFFFNEGYLYGVVAFFRPEYLAKSDAAFKKVIEHFNATRDENGNTYPLLEARLPYTYLDAAIFDHEIGGTSRKADVEASLKALVTLVTANPQRHTTFISHIARAKDDATTWSSLVRRVRLEALAKISPEFKVFLIQNGWELK